MSRKAYVAVLVMVLLRLILIFILLFRGPRFTAQGITVSGGIGQESTEIPDTQVTCAAVGVIGWPSDHAFMDTEPSTLHTWDADLPRSLGDAYVPIATGFEKECSERRNTYLSFLVIVAIPTTVLMSVAIIRRPVQRR